MAWKPEHEAARKAREAGNPELRTKRIQSAKDSYARRREERKAYMQDYYKANPQKFKRTQEQKDRRNAARRERYAADAATRAEACAKSKAWQKSNPDKRKAQRLRKTHGIDLSDFQDMMASQNGRCAICGHSDTSKPKMFPVVDHCHARGRIRGLLCMNCNQGLGKFQDSPELLMAAAAYLAKHG